MVNCEYIHRYGACTTSCIKFNVSCPWMKKAWSFRDILAELFIAAGIIGLVAALVLF